jgi:hypothetical protein
MDDPGRVTAPKTNAEEREVPIMLPLRDHTAQV